jgi:ABC-type uncharacterized transport system substrate-binding protein
MAGCSPTESISSRATYVDRLLLEQPGDLPVQFPTKFEMIVNLRIAKALGVVRHSRFGRAPTRQSNDVIW